MAALAPSPTCTVQLPADLLSDVREFLSDTQKVDAVAVDSFVEAAVENYLLRKASDRVHAATAHLTAEEVMAMVDEALAEVRAER